MRSGASLFGHFIRPMLVPFPLGLFVASFIFDVIYPITGSSAFSESAVLRWRLFENRFPGGIEDGREEERRGVGVIPTGVADVYTVRDNDERRNTCL